VERGHFGYNSELSPSDLPGEFQRLCSQESRESHSSCAKSYRCGAQTDESVLRLSDVEYEDVAIYLSVCSHFSTTCWM
jgi:hypothetical protein